MLAGAIAFLLSSVVGTTEIKAQSGFDPYTVTGVRVTWKTAQGDVPPPVRVFGGAVQAGALLLRRLTEGKYHPRLPVLTPETARRLLENHKIGDVSRKGGRLAALIDYRFSPEKTRSYLRQANISVIDRVSPPVVVLPVWLAEHGAVLWDDPNPLRRAWQEVNVATGLVPIVIPEGGLKDLRLIDGPTAQRGNREPLAQIARKYGAGSVLRVIAERDGKEVKLTVTSFSANVALPAGESWVVYTKKTAAGYTVAVKRIVSRLRQRWKTSLSVPAGPVSRLAVTAPLVSFTHWVGLRRILNNLPRIQRLQIRQLSSTDAQLVLHYVGKLEELQAVLLQKGLQLSGRREGDNEMVWILKRRRANKGGLDKEGSLDREDRPSPGSKFQPDKRRPTR